MHLFISKRKQNLAKSKHVHGGMNIPTSTVYVLVEHFIYNALLRSLGSNMLLEMFSTKYYKKGFILFRH